MRKKTRIGRVMFAVAAALLVAAGAAYATIPDANGVVHGCFARSGGSLRVIDASVTNCKPSEMSLDWNLQGQQGPQGPQGPQGAQGPQGPAGQAATSHAYFAGGGTVGNIGMTPVKAQSLSLPAGTYAVWVTGDAHNFADDSGTRCTLQSGSTVLGTTWADTFAIGTNTDRIGRAALAIAATATLASAGSLDVLCTNTDGSANGAVDAVAITAFAVDALN